MSTISKRGHWPKRVSKKNMPCNYIISTKWNIIRQRAIQRTHCQLSALCNTLNRPPVLTQKERERRCHISFPWDLYFAPIKIKLSQDLSLPTPSRTKSVPHILQTCSSQSKAAGDIFHIFWKVKRYNKILCQLAPFQDVVPIKSPGKNSTDLCIFTTLPSKFNSVEIPIYFSGLLHKKVG